jgi:hypothetical protein
MRKILLIATVLSFVAGSIGLPAAEHFCGKKKMPVSCAKCTKHDAKKSAKGCCTTKTMLNKNASTVVPATTALPLPVIVAILPTLETVIGVPMGRPSAAFLEAPPPLAALASSTYLRNAILLI